MVYLKHFSALLYIGYLYLNDNALSSTIPTSFGNFRLLIELLLDNNQLEGTLPARMGNLIELRKFVMSRGLRGGMLLC